mgnify:CR=1 FL=1
MLPNSFNIPRVFGLGPNVDGQYIILKSLTVLQTYFILIPNNSLYALLNICGVAPSGQRRKLNFKIILGVEFRNSSRQHTRIVRGRRLCDQSQRHIFVFVVDNHLLEHLENLAVDMASADAHDLLRLLHIFLCF